MDPAGEPRVSVVIPARNEEQAIGGLLDRLQQQTVPPSEIVVVDAGSQDKTRDVVRSFPSVRLVEAGPAYPGRARNVGIDAAQHDWIALVDAGCYPALEWLEELLRPLRTTELPQVVFGRCDPVLASEWDLAQAVAILPPADPHTGVRSPTAQSLLIHRTLWRELGGFPGDLRAAEDLLFFSRLAKRNPAQAQAPRARVTWDLAPSVRAYFQRLRLYSLHHLRAGFFRTWHLRVMVMDLAALALAAGGFFVHPALLLIVALGAAARLANTVRRGASNVGLGRALRPDRLFRVAVLLLLADLAAWAGMADFWRRPGNES